MKDKGLKIKYFSLFFLFSFFILFCIPTFAAEKTIGVIMTGDIHYYREIHKSFTEALSSEGLGPGNVEIILQKPVPEPMSWTNAARKLVALDVDAIVSYGTPAAMAAMNETSKIPVIFAAVYDPQEAGIRGKNVTGISSKVPVATLLKNLKSISNFSRLGVVFSNIEKDSVLQINEVKQLENNLQFKSVIFNIKKLGDSSKITNIDALFLTTSCTVMQCVNDIIDIARKAKIPTATILGGEENRGVILTIAANPYEQGREAAKLAAKVIKGTKPSDLPIEQSKKVDVIINLKEAADMDLKVPFDLLTSATKVIK